MIHKVMGISAVMYCINPSDAPGESLKGEPREFRRRTKSQEAIWLASVARWSLDLQLQDIPQRLSDLSSIKQFHFLDTLSRSSYEKLGSLKSNI